MAKIILIVVGSVLGLLVLVTGVRLVLLKQSVSGYKKHWEKIAAEPVAGNSIIYIALGDSTAQGIGATSPGRGYVGLMAKWLGTQERPVHVINISVSGATLRDVIDKQLPQLKNLPEPDYLTVEAGANDMPTFDAKKFEREFNELTAGLPSQKHQKHVVVSDIPSFKSGRASRLNGKVLEANAIIKRNFPSMRLSKAELYAATEHQKIWDVGADLFHPSNHGYKDWADAFEQASIGPVLQ